LSCASAASAVDKVRNVVVRNFFIAGTVERTYYRALASRIDMIRPISG
jgi:hypothetical protein